MKILQNIDFYFRNNWECKKCKKISTTSSRTLRQLLWGI